MWRAVRAGSGEGEAAEVGELWGGGGKRIEELSASSPRAEPPAAKLLSAGWRSDTQEIWRCFVATARPNCGPVSADGCSVATLGCRCAWLQGPQRTSVYVPCALMPEQWRDDAPNP